MSSHMRRTLLALTILTSACISACQREGPPGLPASSLQPSSPATSDGSPDVPDKFVFRPGFQTTFGPVQAGTAFPIRLPYPGRPVLITAIHLLGPITGLSQAIPAVDVPKAVTRISLVECFNNSPLGTFDARAILIPDAAPNGMASKAGDIVAFWLPDGVEVHPARLAEANPKTGERVWLATSLFEGAPTSQRLHGATVRGLNRDGNLEYQYDNAGLSTRDTSGAPILDSEGKVVAINVGGYKEGAIMFGAGNPVDRFRPELERAAAAEIPMP